MFKCEEALGDVMCEKTFCFLHELTLKERYFFLRGMAGGCRRGYGKKEAKGDKIEFHNAPLFCPPCQGKEEKWCS